MVTTTNKSHAGQIARIHFQELSGDFLPSLGLNFLETLYRGILGKKDVWAFCHKNSLTNQVDGFVIGARNIKTLFLTAIKSEGFPIICILLIQIIKKPSLIRNIASTVLYPKKESGPEAELVVICVKKDSQGKGIGKKLVEALEQEFKKNKIYNYKLTVHQNKPATHFYEKLGFGKSSSFYLYGKKWLVYHRYL